MLSIFTYQEKTVDSVLALFAQTLDGLNEVNQSEKTKAEEKTETANELLAQAKLHEIEANRASKAIKRFGALFEDIAPNALPL